MGGSPESSGFSEALSLFFNPALDFIFLCFFGEADFNLLTGLCLSTEAWLLLAAADCSSTFDAIWEFAWLWFVVKAFRALWYWSYGWTSVALFLDSVFLSACISVCRPIRSCLLISLRYLLAVGFMKLPFGRIEAGVVTFVGETLLAISVVDLTGE